jgi:hypothetical protein
MESHGLLGEESTLPGLLDFWLLHSQAQVLDLAQHQIAFLVA